MCKHNTLDTNYPCRRCAQVAGNPEGTVDELRRLEEKVMIWQDTMYFYNSTGVLQEIDLDGDPREIGDTLKMAWQEHQQILREEDMQRRIEAAEYYRDCTVRRG